MKLSQMLLPEYDQEMATTRKLLDRLPDADLTWKPHEKSMALGRLATHLAELPGMIPRILSQDFHDLAPAGAPAYQPKTLGSHQEIVDLFDANVAAGRALLEGAEDEAMKQPWSLRKGDRVAFTLPRIAAIRALILSHSIHHRGQLSVYLRLRDVPLPSIYGPSADEAM